MTRLLVTPVRNAARPLRRATPRRDTVPAPLWEPLAQIAQVLRAARTPDEWLGQTLDILLQATHTAAASVWLCETPELLRFRFHRGLFPDAFAEPPTRAVDGSPRTRSAATHLLAHFQAPDELPELAAHGFVELVSVPLIAHAQLVGMLEIAARHRGEWSPPRLQLVETAAPLLAIALDDTQVSDHAAQRQDELKRLWQAGLEVAAAPDYTQTLRAVVDRARELLGAEASALCLWDERKQYWVLQGASGATDEFYVSVKPFAGRDGPIECPVVRFKARRAHLDVPLTRDGQVLGCLCIATRETRVYSDAERELMGGIAQQATLALANARRVENAGALAVNTERERLAREMHDTLAQLLGFVNFKAQAAREYLAAQETERATQQITQLISITQELYADTREFILGLRAVTTPQRDVLTALAEYCQHFAAFCEMPVTCALEEWAAAQFTPMVELQLLRITQEALSNVRKHAHATRAAVRGTRTAEWDVLEIEDDGRGFNPALLGHSGAPRFGLQSMRERALSIGGTLDIQAASGVGTRIVIKIPRIVRGANDNANSGGG